MHIGDEIVLDHLDRLTDSTGLIQHAIYSIPRRESGYTTDDNARALRLCARLWRRQPVDRMLARVTSYLSFLEFARCPTPLPSSPSVRGDEMMQRGFHNFMSYQRHWLDAEGTGDCQGQAVRALAEVLGSELPDDHRALARELIDAVLPALADLRSIRAQAYVILAWGHLWAAGTPGLEPFESVAWSAANRLVESYQRAARPDWQWFESRMTYANAVLPHALFVAAQRWPKELFRDVGETTFAFLDQATTAEIYQENLSLALRSKSPDSCSPVAVFCPIGSNGWYPHGEDKAIFDQQPVEAATMADAALAAFGLLGDEQYLAVFHRARDWFHGHNSLGLSLADTRSGACCDGLQPSGLNRNQGAESTLAYLWTEVQYVELQQALSDEREPSAASA